MRRAWAQQGHNIIIGAIWGVGIGFALWLMAVVMLGRGPT